uniref:Uncharacterized protein n=1 Tax=Panagrolaimus superbus TaxID=310955 RepID=A0A914Y7X7_9BILA
MADAADNKNVIVDDEPSNLCFHFEAEDKSFPITQQFIQLSGMLRDYIESIPTSSDNKLPVNDFPASSHEILIKLLNLSKENDAAAYEKALQLEHVETEVPSAIQQFCKDLSADECINAANYCAYLSNDFAKHYFVHAFASLVKDTPAPDIRNLTAAFGATPLDKDDIEAHEMEHEGQIWTAYSKIYEDAYGHPYES